MYPKFSISTQSELLTPMDIDVTMCEPNPRVQASWRITLRLLPFAIFGTIFLVAAVGCEELIAQPTPTPTSISDITPVTPSSVTETLTPEPGGVDAPTPGISETPSDTPVVTGPAKMGEVRTTPTLEPTGAVQVTVTSLNRNYPYQAAWVQATHHPRREPS